MQHITIWQDDKGVFFTTGSEGILPPSSAPVRFTHLRIRPDAVEHLTIGSNPVYPNEYQTRYSFDELVEFFTIGVGGPNDAYAVFAHLHIFPSDGTNLSVKTAYTHFCEFYAAHYHGDAPTQTMFTRRMRALNLFKISLSTVNKHTTRVMRNTIYAE